MVGAPQGAGDAAGQPRSWRALSHARLVFFILSVNNLLNTSVIFSGGPLSRIFRLGMPKLSKLLSFLWSFCQSVCLSVCLLVYLSVALSSVCLSVCLGRERMT